MIAVVRMITAVAGEIGGLMIFVGQNAIRAGYWLGSWAETQHEKTP
jgi:hypothetical protein